ncbi:hypothetical protein EDB19DRAFT_1906344 [Suillus lakei]|nr:hypothetical protein EDB19DRAFT_1906344 [Suillus lakei]
MSAIAQNKQNASSRSSPTPTDIDLPTNEDAIDANAVIEEPVVSIEEGLAENMSNTLEQIPDGIKSNVPSEKSAVSIERGLATNMSNILEQILDVLRGSAIAKNVAKMSAGLFSAVNSTFIIGMQPNPGDTTNALLVQLIEITVNGPNSAPDISNLSSSTRYPSSTIWMQMLACYPRVQRLGRAARGRGSLEERGIQRQMKLDGLEYFHLQTDLQAFLVLHQISLLLFSLSLTFGVLIYAAAIFVSVLRPHSPFQTPGSELVGIICKKFLSVRPTLTPNIFGKSFAIRWILETSTNPEVVEAAAAMVPFVQWSPKLDASASYARLLDNFTLCRPELYVKYRKAMAHLCIQSETQTRFIHDVFMAGRAAYDQLKNTQQDDARRKHQADACTAIGTMLVHGRSDRLSRPDDEDLIWHSDLQWRDGDRHAPGCEEFDWLVDYLADEIEHVHVTDDETEGDALLALSANQEHQLGNEEHETHNIHCLVKRSWHDIVLPLQKAREQLHPQFFSNTIRCDTL